MTKAQLVHVVCKLHHTQPSHCDTWSMNERTRARLRGGATAALLFQFTIVGGEKRFLCSGSNKCGLKYFCALAGWTQTGDKIRVKYKWGTNSAGYLVF